MYAYQKHNEIGLNYFSDFLNQNTHVRCYYLRHVLRHVGNLGVPGELDDLRVPLNIETGIGGNVN